MPRTALTVQQPGLAGATPTYAAVDQPNGNSFVWPGYPVLIHAKDTNASPSTMTVAAPAKLGGVSLTAPTLVVPATTGDKMMAIVDPSPFLQSDGSIYLDWTFGTNVTVAVIRLQ